jgi:hypothetical protein
MSNESQTAVEHEERRETEISVVCTEAVDLYVAGRTVQQSALVFQRLLMDHGGPELARVFCLPKDDYLNSWSVQYTLPSRLNALDQGEQETVEAGRAKLVALTETLGSLIGHLQSKQGSEFQYAAHTVLAALRVPSKDCVLFDGEELRIVHWARAGLENGSPAKFDLHDLAHALKPPPVLETLAEERQRVEREAPLTRRMMNKMRNLLVGRRARELRALAGATSGKITVTLMWATDDDLDLAVVCPNGERVYYGEKKVGSATLDVDANAGAVTSSNPIENIFFTTLPASGDYQIIVTNYESRQERNPGSHFELSLTTPAGIGTTEGKIKHGTGALLVASFSIASDGTVSSDLDLFSEIDDVQETD